MPILNFLAISAAFTTIVVALPYSAMPQVQTHYAIQDLQLTPGHVFRSKYAHGLGAEQGAALSMPTAHTVIEAAGDAGDDEEIGALFTTSLPPYQQVASSVRSGSWYVLKHYDLHTQYINWAYGIKHETNGVAWGIECKGSGCQVRTAFVGKPKQTAAGPLIRRVTYHTVWTDKSHQYGKVFCPKNSFAKEMVCKDGACTALKLLCSPVRNRFRPIYSKRWGGVWEVPGYHRVYCPEGKYIDGVECIGSCTTKFNIFCTALVEYK